MLAACLFLAGMHFTNALTYDLYIPLSGSRSTSRRWSIWRCPVFVIVGCVNAVNLTDGIDGLATGVTMPVMLFFLIVSVAAEADVAGIISRLPFGRLGCILML